MQESRHPGTFELDSNALPGIERAPAAGFQLRCQVAAVLAQYLPERETKVLVRVRHSLAARVVAASAV